MIQTHGRSMASARYARLGPQEREKIHLASLEILERVGVKVHDEKARDLLIKGGAWGGRASVCRSTWSKRPWP